MEKTTKNLFTASAILYAVCLAVGFVLIVFFWDFVCGDISLTKDLKPILPLNLIFKVVTMAIAFLCAKFKTKDNSIMPEVLVLVFLCGVVPVLSTVLTQVQSIYVTRAIGTNALASLSLTSQAFNYTSVLCSIGNALIFVALGMRIAEKIVLKDVI